jgi:hypothetical protein
MHESDFLAEIGLTGREMPGRARWIMRTSEPLNRISASARLDVDRYFSQIEFGVYEHVSGETSCTSARVAWDPATGAITLNDGAERIFERFCETVRIMVLDELTPATADDDRIT